MILILHTLFQELDFCNLQLSEIVYFDYKIIIKFYYMLYILSIGCLVLGFDGTWQELRVGRVGLILKSENVMHRLFINFELQFLIHGK